MTKTVNKRETFCEATVFRKGRGRHQIAINMTLYASLAFASLAIAAAQNPRITANDG